MHYLWQEDKTRGPTVDLKIRIRFVRVDFSLQVSARETPALPRFFSAVSNGLHMVTVSCK